MTLAQLGSLDLAYDTFGDPSAEPLLLVMGLGGPLIWWETGLCEQLADAGFHVIRFDNRDTGQSTKIRGKVTLPGIVGAFLGLPVKRPYGLEEMAEDAFALLDHLGIESAHLVGMSMGGMIVQTMAVSHPERVRSLTSIMSTTGKRTVGWQDPRILPALLTPANGQEGFVRNSVRIWSLIESPAFRLTQARKVYNAEATWEYGVSAAGTGRQMMAVLTQRDRTRDLGRLTVPALVVHGLSDRMVHVSGGRATSMAIPGSELLLIKGMGHDLPEPLWPTYVAAIRRTASRATQHAG
ncbi:alpha/beta hydrolase [Nocardioides sp.]|uniref:alpha/beta fold hydrolase n=1 Tax=Nocardioides sp. TaxID=35761 RepID=UPI00260875D1|nr:alpha/beta hydrolase [Nocardioides sp.]